MSTEVYRKRPVEVSMVLWTGDNTEELMLFTGRKFRRRAVPVQPSDNPDPTITAEVFDTLHSTWVGVKTGQRVVQGVAGEYYPIDEAVVRETYEHVRTEG